jgi:predicted enzyme related to lactoylglutathione lyase
MRRVTGVGGIFFKSRDPKALGEWYSKHLGIKLEEWGGAVFQWHEDAQPAPGMTIWSPFKEDTDYFGPSGAGFMVNFRVEKVRDLLDLLRAEGCQVEDKVEDSPFGLFGWVTDPEGNRVELWQPPAA